MASAHVGLLVLGSSCAITSVDQLSPVVSHPGPGTAPDTSSPDTEIEPDTDTDTDETATERPCSETLINSFDVPSCSNRTWRFHLETQCWAGEVFVDIRQTGVTSGVWEEAGHPMSSLDLSPTTQEWGLLLDVVDTPGEVVMGETTLFRCDDEEPGRSSTLTWMFTVFDLDFELSDCVAYGDDPSYYPDCANGNTW